MITKVPHSWSVATWPTEVWPHSADRARWLVRAHRDELVKAGAMTRVGRELVVLGARYDKWLQRQAGNVTTYEFPGKRDEAAA